MLLLNKCWIIIKKYNKCQTGVKKCWLKLKNKHLNVR
jgi:hypothetical protein